MLKSVFKTHSEIHLFTYYTTFVYFTIILAPTTLVATPKSYGRIFYSQIALY